MTNSPVWEPPFAGSETQHLAAALDRLRHTFRWKADDLDAAGLSARLGPSTLTLGGLLKHLAWVEDYTFTRKLTGEAPGEPWDADKWADDEDWEIASAAQDDPSDLYGLYDAAVRRSRECWTATLAADPDLGQLVHLSDGDGRHASLRRVICDLIEEYGRHTGHADLLREAVDGRVGEDPDPSWIPPF